MRKRTPGNNDINSLTSNMTLLDITGLHCAYALVRKIKTHIVSSKTVKNDPDVHPRPLASSAQIHLSQYFFYFCQVIKKCFSHTSI